MKAVGIIANPASGRDIRRLVAAGSVFDNQEKANIVRRVILALDALGLERAILMPDRNGLANSVIKRLKTGTRVEPAEMEPHGDAEDSVRATRLMVREGVGCLITLGGDGTNRVVAKACGRTPLLPLSTGTNNAFPRVVEGTLAGLAAGLISSGRLEPGPLIRDEPKLEVLVNGRVTDLALVDVVATEARFVGSRAVWRPEEVREIFLTRSQPWRIGFSSLGGFYDPRPAGNREGCHLILGDGPREVLAPLGPGMMAWVGISSARSFGPGLEIELAPLEGTLALDGERELEIEPRDRVAVRLEPHGVRVVDVEAVLAEAAKAGLMVRPRPD